MPCLDSKVMTQHLACFDRIGYPAFLFRPEVDRVI